MPVYLISLAIFIVCIIATAIAVTYYNTHLRDMHTLEEVHFYQQPEEGEEPYTRELTDREFENLQSVIATALEGYPMASPPNAAYNYLAIVDKFPSWPDDDYRVQMLTFLLLVEQAES